MGFNKTYRAELNTPVQELSTTTGTSKIKAFPKVTVITSTDNTGVYQLPVPHSGLEKTVVVDFTGATGNLTIANPNTGIVFNGSTANVITVSSSEVQLVISLVGISTGRWAASASTGSGVTLAGSTVTG